MRWSVLALLALAGCGKTFPDLDETLALTLTSPTYGAYLGDEDVVVTGTVYPVTATVLVNGVGIEPADDGTFSVTVPFAEGDRAAVVDVWALHGEQKLREIVPVFDGIDPREADPGAVRGLLTPTGLDALEPVVEDQIDALGWEDQLLSAIPAVDTEYFSMTPTSLTTSGTSVDLAPGEADVSLLVTFHDVALTTEVNVADVLVFDVAVALGEVTMGAHAAPTLDDDMLALTLSDATVSMGDVTFSVANYEIPTEITDLLMDPIMELVSYVGDLLADAILEQAGTLELGGPFAFELPLGDVSLAARLVEVGATLDGVGLGATISVDGEAAAELPELPALAQTTPAGLPYQLGFSMHEGMLNTLMDETLGILLDIDTELEGSTAQMLDPAMEDLPGADSLPSDRDGWCLDLEVQDARVVRMAGGNGAPFAQAWLPDVSLDLEVLRDGSCEDWLEARMFAVADLNLDGGTLSLDFDVRQAWVTDYAGDANRDEVAAALAEAYESGVGQLAGLLSFDLGDLGVIEGVATDPRVVSVEALDETGMYGVYLDVF